jgi:hypothetical protein
MVTALTADVPLTLGSRIIPVPQLPASNSNSSQGLNCSGPQSQSQSHFATDSQLVCLSLCRAPSGAHDQISILIESYSPVHMGRPL